MKETTEMYQNSKGVNLLNFNILGTLLTFAWIDASAIILAEANSALVMQATVFALCQQVDEYEAGMYDASTNLPICRSPLLISSSRNYL